MLKKIAFISLLIANCSLAYAGLSVTPTRTEISLAPGQSFEAKYMVRNDYKSPADVEVMSRNWFLLPEDKDVNISSWVTVLDPEVQLQPGESKEVRYLIQLSTDAAGVRAAMVSFVPHTADDEQGLTLMISASVFVTVAGTEKVQWDMYDLKVENVNDGGIQVAAQIRNSGNVHVRPKGHVKIVSKKGKEAASLEFLEGRPVYPGKERSIIATSDGPVTLAKGKYTAIITLTGAGEEKQSKFDFKVGAAGKIIKK